MVTQNDLRRWMMLCEATEKMSDDDLWQKGADDGAKGTADWEFLGTGRNEEPYWRGFDYGKTKTPKAKIKVPRIPVPANLKGIKRNDVATAYTSLIEGHAMDNVRQIEARDPEEAVEALTDTLNELSRRFMNGVITLYRTIEVEDRDAWVIENMTARQSLGRFWTADENYVMGKADDMVLFCVEATVAAINWPETIVLNVDGVEAEVRLMEGAAVVLRYVEPAPYDFKPEKSQII